MAKTDKARIVGHVICVSDDDKMTVLKGKVGRVIKRTHGGTLAVMLIDGLRYRVPTSAIETVLPEKGGVKIG